MPYDEILAERIRQQFDATSGMKEQRMFGGLAFLLNGHMTVVASRTGGLMARVDPSDSDDLIENSVAEAAEMRGRRMQGWLRINTQDIKTKRQLNKWVRLATAYVATLPNK